MMPSYHPQTFRLMRQRSEKYTQTDWEFESDNNVKQDTAYQYDLAGNIIATNDRTTGCGPGGTDELDRDFDYDPLYRLLKATGRENAPTITPIWDDAYRSPDNSLTTSYDQNYQYDRMGNILKLQHIGNNSFTRVFSYSGSHNKLQSIEVGMNTHTFAYDANGNQISENADRHYEWDAFDRLKSFRIQAGTSEPTKYAHYLYDAAGNRVKKLVRVQGGDYTSTTYIDGIFESLTDGDDTQNTLHIMDDRSRIATVRLGDDFGDLSPITQYNLEDHLGSSCVVLDNTGVTISKEEYYPFGETSFGSYAKKRYKYCGKERDNESGLYYYGARYYAAWSCRFVSVDPLAADYTYYTPYQYAGNKPINKVDIDGLEEEGAETDNGKPMGNTNPPNGELNHPTGILKPADVIGALYGSLPDALKPYEKQVIAGITKKIDNLGLLIGSNGKLYLSPGKKLNGQAKLLGNQYFKTSSATKHLMPKFLAASKQLSAIRYARVFGHVPLIAMADFATGGSPFGMIPFYGLISGHVDEMMNQWDEEMMNVAIQKGYAAVKNDIDLRKSKQIVEPLYQGLHLLDVTPEIFNKIMAGEARDFNSLYNELYFADENMMQSPKSRSYAVLVREMKEGYSIIATYEK